jgi:hypothetical protein
MTGMKTNLQRARFDLLIALLISATLFALACGKQVETARKTENRANEAAAIRALHSIYLAQTHYSVVHSGNYGTFDELIKEDLLDQRFSGHAPVIDGYVFTILTVPEQDSSPGTAFMVNADPQDVASAGARHLYIDSDSNTVKASAERPAKTTDPPLE